MTELSVSPQPESRRLPDLSALPISSVWAQGLFLYLLCFFILVYLLFSNPMFISLDDYFHTRISELYISQGRLALDFPWLPQTVMSPERFVDPHLLFHMILAPFVYLWGDVGVKLAISAIGAGMFTMSWTLLRSVGVRYALLWTLGMLGVSMPFLYRIMMIRVQGAVVLTLLIALYLMFHKRYRWLIVLGFLFTWLYYGFVILMAFAGLYTVALWISERRFAWQPVVYCGIGMALGLVINPYFPNNVIFITEQLVGKAAEDIPLGAEWEAVSTYGLVFNSLGTLVALAFAFLKPSFTSEKRDVTATTLLLVALLTLLMAFHAVRFFEYAPAFTLLFCAVTWGRGEMPVVFNHERLNRLTRRYAVVALAVVVLGFCIHNVTNVYGMVQRSDAGQRMIGAATWLENYAPEGSMIFSTAFNDFSYLFYRNTQHVYSVGLDPTFLSFADTQLWDTYYALVTGNIDQPGQTLRDVFHADYALSYKGYDNRFNQLALNDPLMQIVYDDEQMVVWRVLEPGAVW